MKKLSSPRSRTHSSSTTCALTLLFQPAPSLLLLHPTLHSHHRLISSSPLRHRAPLLSSVPLSSPSSSVLVVGRCSHRIVSLEPPRRISPPRVQTLHACSTSARLQHLSDLLFTSPLCQTSRCPPRTLLHPQLHYRRLVFFKKNYFACMGLGFSSLGFVGT